MTRRKLTEHPAAAETMPVNLLEFMREDWLPELAKSGQIDPPRDWGFGVAYWRQIQAAELWEAAGKSWLAERGRDAREWYRLTREAMTTDYEPLREPSG